LVFGHWKTAFGSQAEVPSDVPAGYKYSRHAQGPPPPPPFAHVAPMIGLPVEARPGCETRPEPTHRLSDTSGLLPAVLGLVAAPVN
jgi:hypothetical protein